MGASSFYKTITNLFKWLNFLVVKLNAFIFQPLKQKYINKYNTWTVDIEKIRRL